MLRKQLQGLLNRPVTIVKVANLCEKGEGYCIIVLVQSSDMSNFKISTFSDAAAML